MLLVFFIFVFLYQFICYVIEQQSNTKKNKERLMVFFSNSTFSFKMFKRFDQLILFFFRKEFAIEFDWNEIKKK